MSTNPFALIAPKASSPFYTSPSTSASDPVKHKTPPTAFGQPLTPGQQAIAKTILNEGKAYGANGIALAASMYAAMGETNLGANPRTYENNGKGYWGVLQGNISSWPNPHDVAGQAQAFFTGTGPQGQTDFHTGAVNFVQQGLTNIAQIAVQVEVPSVWPDDAYAPGWAGGQKQGITEAKKIVQWFLGGGITFSSTGGVAGLGGTGSVANLQSPWTTVGDVSNPDQDYYSTITQYTSDAQWYAWSDGEYFYIADAILLMAQQPAAVIIRTDSRVIALELTYDNTSFTWAITASRPKVGIQRRATLARTTSPTELSLSIICDIDDYRAGDTVYMLGLGPGDGLWLIADVTRSIFQPYSKLTLSQGIMPLSAATGETVAQPSLSGGAASKPGSGTVITSMLSRATTIDNLNLPYVWGGGHASCGNPSKGDVGGGPGANGINVGFDCSGAVAAVLAQGGLGFVVGEPVGGDYSIIQTLLNAKLIYPGQGTGRPECTLFDNPGVHIYMRLNGQYWGTGCPTGEPDNAQADGQSGGGWIRNGSAAAGFNAYHVPSKILGTLTNSTATGSGTSS